VLVIDHLGLRHPPRDPAGPELFAPLPELLALAAFRNVAVKFSGVPALSRERYPFGDIWPEARRVIDAFGPDRLMWGSDYTRCERLHSYADSVDFVRCSEDLSESDKAALMGGTLRRILRWHRTPP
jgi:predicted TIM-barrel fold metal-dependent hydrolase